MVPPDTSKELAGRSASQVAGAPRDAEAAGIGASARSRSEAAAADLGEAVELVERQRREAVRAGREADERRRRAAAHAGGPRDPRTQGLWDAAAFHAERARLAEARLAAVERQAEAIRARAAAARRAAEEDGGARPCG